MALALLGVLSPGANAGFTFFVTGDSVSQPTPFLNLHVINAGLGGNFGNGNDTGTKVTRLDLTVSFIPAAQNARFPVINGTGGETVDLINESNDPTLSWVRLGQTARTTVLSASPSLSPFAAGTNPWVAGVNPFSFSVSHRAGGVNATLAEGGTNFARLALRRIDDTDIYISGTAYGDTGQPVRDVYYEVRNIYFGEVPEPTAIVAGAAFLSLFLGRGLRNETTSPVGWGLPHVLANQFSWNSVAAILITMSRYRRVIVAGGTYFFTLVTHRRTPLFADGVARRCLREAIASARCVDPVAEAVVRAPRPRRGRPAALPRLRLQQSCEARAVSMSARVAFDRLSPRGVRRRLVRGLAVRLQGPSRAYRCG